MKKPLLRSLERIYFLLKEKSLILTQKNNNNKKTTATTTTTATKKRFSTQKNVIRTFPKKFLVLV